MDYQNAMTIDRNNLDEEAIQLPGWFGYVVEQEAIAADEVAGMTDKMKVLQADINLMIRGWTVPQINIFYGLALTKTSEQTFTSLVLIHPEVMTLQNKMLKSKHKKALYTAATRSLEKKGDMLKELAKLFAQGYYMRIEGKAYNMPKMDLMLKNIKTQLIERAKTEIKTTPPADKARADLTSRIEGQEANEDNPTSAPQKTLKTIRKTTQAPPKRVKG